MKSGLQGASLPEHRIAYLPSGLPEQAMGMPQWAWCLACLYTTGHPFSLHLGHSMPLLYWALEGLEARKRGHTDKGNSLSFCLSLPFMSHAKWTPESLPLVYQRDQEWSQVGPLR